MALDDILNQVPIDDIAEKLGVSRDEAKVAVEQGGAVLLGGLAKNAQTDEGSAAIQNALKKHEGSTSAARVEEIDASEGDKIVAHILGSSHHEVAAKLTESKATPGIDFGKLLPILAPVVMSLVANASKDKSAKADAGAESSGGIGDLIGGILAGADKGGSSGGGLGDVIGGLLGGGNRNSSGGGIDLGGILGGLFGGKK